MGSISYYGVTYKAKVVSKLPFVKNVIIESVERRKWHWLLKVLTSSIETEIIYNIFIENNKYYKEDFVTYDTTEITKEEADALLEQTNTKYGSIMQAAWDYNIPVYIVAQDHVQGILIKMLTPICKSANNIVAPGSGITYEN